MIEPELFSCGAERYTPAHVLAAAAFWGELDELYVESRMRLQAVKRARNEAIEVSDGELQERSERFRRSRGLRSASATDAWMSSRGVTLDNFTDFLERDTLREMLGGGPGRARRKHPTTDSATMVVLWPDATFTGLGDAWIQRLAIRAAAAREVAEGKGIPASLFNTGKGGAADGMLPWLEHFGLGAPWFDRLTALDAAFAHFSASIQTPARLDAALRARWDTLFAVDLELGGFDSEPSAREALLCVTEDGVSIEEVCHDAGGLYNLGKVLLGDLPGPIRSQALSISVDAFLPIFAWDNRFFVCCVRGKSEPSLDDRRVREVVAAALLAEELHPLVNRHITWPGAALI